MIFIMGFPGGASSKELACQSRRHKRHRFNPWVGEIPWRRAWQPTSVFLPGESHGHMSLAGYSPWDRKESDMTWHTCQANSGPLPLLGQSKRDKWTSSTLATVPGTR